MKHLFLLLFLLLAGAVPSAHADSVTLAWDDPLNPSGYDILRCTVGAPAQTCTPATDLPGMPISGGARTYVDATATTGTTQCWSVQAQDAQGNRSLSGTTPDGVTRYACLQLGTPPAEKLGFGTQPQNTPVGQAQSVVVHAQDFSGNLSSGYAGNVTVALASNPGVVPFGLTSLVSVDSQETVGQPYAGSNALDGSPSTFWHTQYTPTDAPVPHTIIVNLGRSFPVSGFRYLPRQDAQVNGTIAQYALYVSTDGSTWGAAVAASTFPTADTSLKTVTFTPKTGQYVQLVALTEINGNPWTSMAELTTLYDVGTACPGTLSAASGLTHTAIAGQATFPDLVISAGGTCQLVATAVSLQDGNSTVFVVSGAATHLAFVAQPSTVTTGQVLPPVTVQFLDASEGAFPTTQAVNIALATCPGATLSGTASRAANAAGLATFNDLSVNIVCPSATLVASATGMTGTTSQAFAVQSPIPNPFLTGQWVADGVSAHACASTGGDTNFSSTAPAVYTHTLTCPLPANLLHAGSLLQVCALIDVVTGGTGTRPAFQLLANSTTIATNASGGTPPNLSSNAWVCFDVVVTGNPGAAVATYTSFFASPPAFPAYGSPPNQTAQPVNLATNGAITLGFASSWPTSVGSANSLTLHGMIVGLAQ